LTEHTRLPTGTPEARPLGELSLVERLIERIAKLEIECQGHQDKQEHIRGVVIKMLSASKTKYHERHAALLAMADELAKILEFSPEEQRTLAVAQDQRPSKLQRATAYTAKLFRRTVVGAKYLARWQRRHARKKHPPKKPSEGSSS